MLSAAIGHATAEVGLDGARERWLPGVASGETFLAHAVTEPECGHNMFRTQTRCAATMTGGCTTGFNVSSLRVAESTGLVAASCGGSKNRGQASSTQTRA
jgi:hypothetical protein